MALSTDTLAKSYPILTPQERVPLIVAAVGRRDMVEVERLAGLSPLSRFVESDWKDFADGLVRLGGLVRERLLYLSWKYTEMRDGADRFFDTERVSERCENLAGVFGYFLKVTWRGWSLFCGDLGIGPEAFLEDMPGFDDVMKLCREATRSAKESAPDSDPDSESDPVMLVATEAEARQWFESGRGGRPDASSSASPSSESPPRYDWFDAEAFRKQLHARLAVRSGKVSD
jgi:hypothetical protein